jgi:hypothetical protein
VCESESEGKAKGRELSRFTHKKASGSFGGSGLRERWACSKGAVRSVDGWGGERG